MSRNENDENATPKPAYGGKPEYGGWGSGIAIGLGIGVALGVAMHNIGAGIAIGVGIGVAFEASFTTAAKRRTPGSRDKPNGPEGAPSPEKER